MKQNMEKNTSVKETTRTFSEAEMQQAVSAVTSQYRETIAKYQEALVNKRLEYLFKVLKHKDEFSKTFIAEVIYEIEESLTVAEEGESND